MRIGLITYDSKHLKTEQLVCKYVENDKIKEVNLYALQFKSRKERIVRFSHRPMMEHSVPTSSLAILPKVSFQRWDGIQNISQDNDLFVIGGAGVLDIRFASGKPIVNSHPGIIPLTRGLDSFKWAIYNDDPLGNTLHLIDNEVDKGEILQIKHTPVFIHDTIETLARRHYENELDMLANVLEVMDDRIVIRDVEKPATMRMNFKVEEVMLENFGSWKLKIVNREKLKN